MAGANQLVLIIEDDPLVADLLGRAFALDGYATVCADSGAAARRALEQHRPALITLDLYLPDAYGLDLLAQLRAAGLVAAPVVVITTDTTAVRCAAGLAAAVLLKPFSIGELLDTAAALCACARARALGE